MYNINPATASKGLNILADNHVLYKKRGLGMFVTENAADIIIHHRKTHTLKHMVEELVLEASRLNVSESELIQMIHTHHNKPSFHIEENKLTGLIGRNGAGKTTLLHIMAGFMKPTSGEIKVFSELPFNNLTVSSNMIFIDDSMPLYESLNLGQILQTARSFYENWNGELTQRLLDYFSLSVKQSPASLSKGIRNTLHIIIGLSARCALTIMDEPTTAMDSSVRKDFYRALLKDYMEFPRTIILSSHLLHEIKDMLEDVLLIKEGQICLHKPIADLKGMAIGLRGQVDLIDKFTHNMNILHKRSMGKNGAYIVVHNDFSNSRLQEAKVAGLEVLPGSTDDLCGFLTSKSKEGIDDVFHSN